MSEYRVPGALDEAEGAQIKSTLFSSEHVQSHCDAAVDSDATAHEQSASLFPTFHWLPTITTAETDHLSFLQIQQKGFFCLLSPLNMYNFPLIKVTTMSIITIANKLEHRCVSLGKNISSLTSELMVPGQDAVPNNHNCQNPRCICFILSYVP